MEFLLGCKATIWPNIMVIFPTTTGNQTNLITLNP